MWVVVGLGNPGREYALTRHNAGFMVIDSLAKRWHVSLATDRHACRGRGTYAGHPVQLLQPLTYMNRSGDVLEISDEDAVIAAFDDLELAPGRLRIRPRGGAGGHRGVASMIDRLGEGFARVRIGIGRPPAGVETADYVLQPMCERDLQVLHAAVERACDAIETIITEGTAAAMSRFNAAPASSADPC